MYTLALIQRANCSNMNSVTIMCVSPDLEGPGVNVSTLDYSLIMDALMFKSANLSDLVIRVQPDPTNFRLGDVTNIVTRSTTIIQILVWLYMCAKTLQRHNYNYVHTHVG